MLTMPAAAKLLSAARSVERVREALHAAGVVDATDPIEPASAEALGLEPDAMLGAGVGAIRVLVLCAPPGVRLRDEFQRVSRRLASRAPHVLWIVAGIDAAGEQAGVTAWPAGDGAPRLASFVWEPQAVVDSDAETLCAISAVAADEELLRHARYIEVLGRDSLTRRFYRALEEQIGLLAASLTPAVAGEDRRALALLYTSRLLFLRFLEAKGWLNGERAFIVTRFDDCMRGGGGFHRRVLLPLFFGTLNTPVTRRAPAARALGRIPFLNGGLFTRTALERRARHFVFTDEAIGTMLDRLFARYRFVARENSATWSEASVDPEMLGRAFESLMAGGERRSTGAFYTPHELVARVAGHALEAATKNQSLGVVRDLRVLDPACGSGAFLVFVLEQLADLRRHLGDTGSVSSIRRDVLARSIFGVDRNPTAVWLCELRLWLSVVIEIDEPDPQRVPPLPNLDRNIRVGDALAGPGFTRDAVVVTGGRRLAGLRQRYTRSTGTRKSNLARVLDREERARLLAQLDREIQIARHARQEAIGARRARDLFGERAPTDAAGRRALKALREKARALRRERRRIAEGGALPFSFAAFFADAQARGGFDLVVGNPPWVRLHRIPIALRLRFREMYGVYRGAAWAAGAAGARAAAGFAGQVDVAALFVERSLTLLREGGVVSLLLPVKLWRSLAGGGVRELVARSSQILRLEDLSRSRHAFDAAVYPSLLVARTGGDTAPAIRVARHRPGGADEWDIPPERLPFDDSPGAPWLTLPPRARAAFDLLRDSGTPLASACWGAPRLGVKSGCNVAFVVRVTDTRQQVATVTDSDGETGTVELSLLRPALRGESVVPWSRAHCNQWILWTHDERGAPLARLPQRGRAWLQRRYGELTSRADAARARRWWSLFRVDAADARTARVVWADFGRRPRALVVPAGDPVVPLNTCYVLRCPDEEDAWALAALLNSPVAAAWLNAIAEPARGDHHRYLGWTVGLLPLPRAWTRARAILSAARGLDDEFLVDAAAAAYGLERHDLLPLLECLQ